MHHKPKSIHIHVLMSGHNSEHHHGHKSHRGTSNVHHHMKHEGSHGHNISHEKKHTKPCDILMREHHYNGGISGTPPHFSKGGKAHRGRKFAEGGHVDHESKGGRPLRRHADGGDINEQPMIGSRGMFRGPNMNLMNYGETKSRNIGYPRRKKGGSCYAEGGETQKEYGEKPLTGQLHKGGRAKHRDHHYEGEPVSDNSVREEKRKGGRAKRQHHYWGQNVIGRLPLVGGLANTIANTAGTLDPHKYGGAEYVAKKKGQKAADILSTIGNLGATVALLKKGGGVHHKHRHHHAAGGAGKVRKGMMTESGRMIHYDD